MVHLWEPAVGSVGDSGVVHVAEPVVGYVGEP